MIFQFNLEGFVSHSIYLRRILCLLAVALLVKPLPLVAAGISHYLPLQQSPEIERQVERLLVMADMPVMIRPIAISRVKLAVKKVCQQDSTLCQQVESYLSRYDQEFNINNFSAKLNIADGDNVKLANERGEIIDNHYALNAQAYWQPSEYLLLSAGGMVKQENSNFEGTYLSTGWDSAQLDFGFRTHWLSPFSSNAMIYSTNAQAIPSLTLSNAAGLTDFKIQYELFAGVGSYSDKIAWQDGYTEGKPSLIGMHVSFEPVDGLSIGFNRAMQFGGGERGGRSLSDILKAFFDPGGQDNTGDDLSSDQEMGNQIASFTSRITVPGKVPFSVYFEYSGEDTSFGENWRLGNAALQAGVHFPMLWQDFDLTYEVSEWQNAWYVSHIYQDGFTNHDCIMGHWGANDRMPSDAVGAQAHLLKINWQLNYKQLLSIDYKTVTNESYSAYEYRQGHNLVVRYSYSQNNKVYGVLGGIGRDTLDNDFTYLSLFFNW